ncbi:hypothetical protein D3C73_1051230 [compost metagenome]
MHFLVGLAPSLDVGIEGAGTEYQVGDEGEVGNEEQRHGPGDGPLGSTHGKHRMQRGDDAKQVNEPEHIAEEVGAVVIHTHPAWQIHSR